MNKTIFESFDGFTRAYPIIIVFSSFINSIFNSTNEGYIFMVLLLVSNFLNHFLKVLIFKPIMGNKNFPILGLGKRPDKAKNCKLFHTNEISRSYGMPSGHSQISALFSTYLILKIINNKELHIFYKLLSSLSLFILAIMVMYSRVYWSKCHTIQQVIVGGLIGTLLGYLIYKYKEYIFEHDWCYRIFGKKNKK